MEEKKSVSFILRVSLVLLVIAVLSYAIYHVASLFREDMTTIAAGTTTERTAISASGYVFRDESVLYSPYGGVVDYEVRDGEKVSRGQALAYVHEGSNGEYQKRYLQLLDEQIAILRESDASAVKDMDISVANTQVSDSYDSIVKLLAAGKAGGLDEEIDKMLIGLNRREVISGEGGFVSATLETLLAARASVLSGGKAHLQTATESGYFYSVVDGYEQLFSLANAEKVTPDNFYSLLHSIGNQKNESGKIAYGKLAADSNWKFIIPLSASEADSFAEQKTYNLSFFRSNGLSLPMTLDRILRSENSSECLLAFSCDRLPSDFVLNRCEDVEIEISSVSGMYVPKHAVSRVNGRLGVYILRGSVVHFRCIEVVHEENEYYLVREDASSQEEGVYYLRPNDMIILNGYQLFDGRIMD